MTEPKYLKCPCQKCGGSIEFPVQGLGLGVNCPHCGQRTTLFIPEAVLEGARQAAAPLNEASVANDMASASESPAGAAAEAETVPESGNGRKPRRLIAMAVLLLLLASAGAGGFFYWKKRPVPPPPFRVAALPAKTNRPPAAQSENIAPAEPPAAKASKSIDDLKVGTITLEKAKSGSLIYAVGVLKNDSDYPRYGVRIELDVSDSTGSRTSKTSDQTQVIEPRKEWRFRALLLDSRAVSAKLSRITEDE